MSSLNKNSPSKLKKKDSPRKKSKDDEQINIPKPVTKSRSRPVSAIGLPQPRSNLPRPRSAQPSPTALTPSSPYVSATEMANFVYSHQRLVREVTESLRAQSTLLATLERHGIPPKDINDVTPMMQDTFLEYVGDLEKAMEVNSKIISGMRDQAHQLMDQYSKH